MKFPSANEIIGAVIFGIELAVAAIVGMYIINAAGVPDKAAADPESFYAKLMEYKYLAVALVLIIIGMFFKPGIMFKLAMAFIAFQIMIIAEVKIKELVK